MREASDKEYDDDATTADYGLLGAARIHLLAYMPWSNTSDF